MKSKISKIAFLGGVAVLGLGASVQAQTVLKNVKINIDLKEAIGVGGTSVNSPDATFLYQAGEDYNAEKTVLNPSQFLTFSTSPYNVVVRADGNFKGGDNTEIDLNVIRVSAKTSGVGTFGPEVIPSTTDQPLFLAKLPATLGQTFDVLYKIPKNADFIGLKKQVYSTNFVYSITAN